MISLTAGSGSNAAPRQSIAESLEPSVCYGSEPLVLRLASLLGLELCPRAFCGADPSKTQALPPGVLHPSWIWGSD